MIPAGIVAERIAVEAGLVEVFQPVEIPSRELIVRQLFVVELMVSIGLVTVRPIVLERVVSVL
jgi:hypothetical protein